MLTGLEYLFIIETFFMDTFPSTDSAGKSERLTSSRPNNFREELSPSLKMIVFSRTESPLIKVTPPDTLLEFKLNEFLIRELLIMRSSQSKLLSTPKLSVMEVALMLTCPP